MHLTFVTLHTFEIPQQDTPFWKFSNVASVFLSRSNDTTHAHTIAIRQTTIISRELAKFKSGPSFGD